MASDKRISNRFRCESGRRGNFLIFYAHCFQFCLAAGSQTALYRPLYPALSILQAYIRHKVPLSPSIALAYHHLLGDIGLHHRLMSEIGHHFYRKQIDHTREVESARAAIRSIHTESSGAIIKSKFQIQTTQSATSLSGQNLRCRRQ